jgi:uncharacterized protein (DUF2384 family)
MRIDPVLGTPEGIELNRLVTAVEQFERERYPISCCAFAAKMCAARALNLFRQLGDVYDIEGAVHWCESPQPLLDSQRPIDMLATDSGTAAVFEVVARLRDGVYL